MASVSHWRRRVHQSLLQDPCVAEVLSPDAVDRHCREAGHTWRETFWSPAMTLLAFLVQVLSGEKTLRAAVSALSCQLAKEKGRKRGHEEKGTFYFFLTDVPWGSSVGPCHGQPERQSAGSVTTSSIAGTPRTRSSTERKTTPPSFNS